MIKYDGVDNIDEKMDWYFSENERLESRVRELEDALKWLESWHKENKDGRHHCPWCYLSGQNEDGEDADWNKIKHHPDCLIGAALEVKP